MNNRYYKPTEAELEMVRQHIDENSGWQYKGMRKRDYLPALYPKGITSFADQVGLTRATVSKALNGHPTSRRTWQKIVSEANVYKLKDKLELELATIRGISVSELRRRLNMTA